MTNLKGVADHAESTLGKTVSELTEDDLTTGEPTSEYSLSNEIPDGDDNKLMCFASMFVRQVRQCFSVVWADGFPRCRHRFPVM